MKHSFTLIVNAFAFALALSSLQGCLERDDKKALAENFSKMSYLNGSWEGKYDEGLFYLNYKKENDSLITGDFTLIRFADTVVTNSYRIFFNGKQIQFDVSTYSYTKKVHKKFDYIFQTFKDSTFLFSSMSNEYPQQVSFTLSAEGGLVQRFEGTLNGAQANKIEYVYQRKADH